MNLFKDITNFFTGGFGDFALKVVKDYFPPDLSPEQQATMELGFKQLELETQKQISQATLKAEKQLNQRIETLEGSAADLLKLPVVGRVVIFLRGCQRPLWGYATLYLDYLWFTTSKVYTENQEIALIAINLLVLFFLFGERATKNLIPLVTRFLASRKSQ